MLRTFFSWLFGFVYMAVTIPSILMGVLFATWFNVDYVQRSMVPASYEIMIDVVSGAFKAQNIEPPQGNTFESWLGSVIPREDYVAAARAGVYDFADGLEKIAKGEETTISLKETKSKILSVLERAVGDFPACEAGHIPIEGEVLSCLPVELTGEQRAFFTQGVLQEFDAALPSQISIDGEEYAEAIGNLKTLFEFKEKIRFYAFIMPLIFLALVALIRWKPIHKILRSIGSLLLVTSFESFILLMLFSNMGSVLQKAVVLSTPGATAPTVNVENIFNFLFGFPSPWFMWISIFTGVLGFVAIVFGGVIKYREEEGGKSEGSPSKSKPKMPNGTVMRGSSLIN
jgi:hypothetical protein